MAGWLESGVFIIVSGQVLHKDGTPNVAVRVKLVSDAEGTVYGDTTTDRYGNFSISLPKASTPSGVYSVEYFGSDYREAFTTDTPPGDWEKLTIITSGAITQALSPANLKVTVVPNALPNTAGWYNASVLSLPGSGVTETITVVGDNFQSLSYRVYEFGGTPGSFTVVESSTFPLLITTEQRNVLECYATDKYGNQTAITSVAVAIDKTPPTWSVGSDNHYALTVGGYGLIGLTFEGAMSDPEPASNQNSGLGEIVLWRNTSNSRSGATQIATIPANAPGYADRFISVLNQEYYYFADLYDNAGNMYQVPAALAAGQTTIPLEPADVAGALGEINPVTASNTPNANYVSSDTNYYAAYSVPVQIKKFIVAVDASSGPVTISGIDFYAPAALPSVSDPVFSAYTGTVSVDNAPVTGSFTLTSASGLSIHVVELEAQANVYWIKLAGSGFTQLIGGTNGAYFMPSTFLAADEIDAGRIRVEQGISIWNGSSHGTLIDQLGIQLGTGLNTASPQYFVTLLNTPDASGNYATFGAQAGKQVLIDGSGNLTIQGAAIVNYIQSSTYSAGVSGSYIDLGSGNINLGGGKILLSSGLDPYMSIGGPISFSSFGASGGSINGAWLGIDIDSTAKLAVGKNFAQRLIYNGSNLYIYDADNNVVFTTDPNQSTGVQTTNGGAIIQNLQTAPNGHARVQLGSLNGGGVGALNIIFNSASTDYISTFYSDSPCKISGIRDDLTIVRAGSNRSCKRARANTADGERACDSDSPCKLRCRVYGLTVILTCRDGVRSDVDRTEP